MNPLVLAVFGFLAIWIVFCALTAFITERQRARLPLAGLQTVVFGGVGMAFILAILGALTIRMNHLFFYLFYGAMLAACSKFYLDLYHYADKLAKRRKEEGGDGEEKEGKEGEEGRKGEEGKEVEDD